MIRTIDAVKSFDIIYVITQGGPGTASETINIYLYSVPSPITTSATPRRSRSCSSSLIVALAAAAALSAPAHAMERDRRPAHEPAADPRQDRPLASRSFVIVSPAILFFLWMLSLSLKNEIDNTAYPPVFIPERFAWKNYADVLASNRFPTYFVNSLIVTGDGDPVRAARRRAGRLRHRPHGARTSRRS